MITSKFHAAGMHDAFLSAKVHGTLIAGFICNGRKQNRPLVEHVWLANQAMEWRHEHTVFSPPILATETKGTCGRDHGKVGAEWSRLRREKGEEMGVVYIY